MFGRLCGGQAGKVFDATVLRRHPTAYFRCTICGFVQTQEPFWLEQAYSDAISAADTGIVTRNIYLMKVVAVLLRLFRMHAGTYLDYGGVPRPSDMDSRSLRPLLEGRTRSHREHVLSGLNGWRSVSDGRDKLVRGWGDAGDLLYDIQDDPYEDVNIIGKAKAEAARLAPLLPAVTARPVRGA